MDCHPFSPSFPDFLDEPAAIVARKLLGCVLVSDTLQGRAVVRIVETEAYDQNDAASHSFRGQTPRTAVMFGPSGHLYVYFTYGMHYCCNVVCGPQGQGAAVLIRAVEPLAGQDVLQLRRPRAHVADLTNGPAKLCQAMAIDRSLNGHDLRRSPLQLRSGSVVPAGKVVRSTRVGVTKSLDAPLRFYVVGNPYVSVC